MTEEEVGKFKCVEELKYPFRPVLNCFENYLADSPPKFRRFWVPCLAINNFRGLWHILIGEWARCGLVKVPVLRIGQGKSIEAIHKEIMNAEVY